MAHGDHLKYSGKPKAGKKTFLRLISYVACDRRLLIVIGVLIVISIAANLTGSYMLRPIINEYILPGDFQGLVRILLFLAAIYLTGVAATYIEYILLNKIGQRTVTRMREELFGKMERLPVRYFDTHQHGDVMSRYTNDIDRISDALTDSLSDMLSSALTVIGIFCLMIFISPILTAVTLITVPLMFLSAKGIVKRSRKYFKAQQEALGMMNGYAEEMISGQKVVKVFGHEQKVETDFGILNQSLKDKSSKAQFYSGLMMPVMQNLNTLNYVIITIVGALLAIFRGFDVGGLAAFLQYSRQFGRPINELASLYNSIQAAIAGAERIFEIIDEAPEKADVPEAVTLKNIKGGKKIALVGATGAGKTPILNLLPRLFDIQSGEITIDNHPIDRIERNSLRRSMAIVLQDTHLFTGTVRENIRFGRLSATDDEVVAAARLTAAHSFIKRLPQGYDTLLENDGANLSQGQRQLLNIARAAVADPAILLLDEATSNIDTRSEILIQRGLDQLMQGRTSLIIAHRLSTIRNADTILVLEHGEIIEQGSHQELLALKGKYYSLNEEQFK